MTSDAPGFSCDLSGYKSKLLFWGKIRMFSLKMYFNVVCVSTLIVLVVGVTAEESENNTEAPVRHRHRHHHRSDAESDEFVAAWKQSPEEGSADGSINSLEARLETLEDDVVCSL